MIWRGRIPHAFEVSFLLNCRWLAGWRLSPVCMHAPNVEIKKKKKSNQRNTITSGYPLFKKKKKSQAAAQPRGGPSDLMCYSLRKRAGRIVFLNHPRCPCHAPNYDASCAAPRCAARRQAAVVNSGSEPPVRQAEEAEEAEDSTAQGLNNTVRLRLGLLMGFLSLPLSPPPRP